jgi:3-hydroxyisobutyrate dehydrogenase-like beta-hydroxyacid dehydrogenase
MERTAITVIGLGEMGSAIAAAFVGAGHTTTVWNRTPGRAGALVATGAREAATLRDAVAASPLVLVSVTGHEAARAVLTAAGDTLRGRAVLNLTDGTSAEARATAELAGRLGADYLHGQIMTIAPGVGHPEATVFVGGAEQVYERHRAAVGLLGGGAKLVSDDPGVPALYGMAVHDTMWGALNGFLHATALVTSAGIPASTFLDQAGPAITGLLTNLPPLTADEVDRGEYATEYGALKAHLPSVDDVVRESRDLGVDDELPGYTHALVAGAVDAGHGNDSYSRLIDHFRKPQPR